MHGLPLNEGHLFAGRYRIGRLIASGGMGIVYEARHLVTGRRCAVKIMMGHVLEDPELRSRFLQEARAAARIRSAHVVDILDAGIEESLQAPFLVMELLEGEDLAQRITRRGAMAAADAVACLWQVAIALDKLHRAGVVHRDLKPRNLFVTRTEHGTPLFKVVDFGIAKILRRETTSDQGTQNVGTPLFMAPEQFQSEARVSAATDIYALGMIAYTLLVGAHYWTEEHQRSDNPFAFSRMVSDGPLESATARAARLSIELPSSFDDWFARATAVSPEVRFQSATEAVTELALALDVPAPLMEPDEVSGEEDQDDPSSTDDPSKPTDATATVPSVRVTGGTRRDPEATQASLSVTHGGRSQGRRRGRTVLALAAIVALPVAGAVLFFTFGRPLPHRLEASGAERLRLASQAAQKTLPRNSAHEQPVTNEPRSQEEAPLPAVEPQQAEPGNARAPSKPAAVPRPRQTSRVRLYKRD